MCSVNMTQTCVGLDDCACVSIAEVVYGDSVMSDGESWPGERNAPLKSMLNETIACMLLCEVKYWS